jgi:sulfite exporter TauE/SafE
MLSWFSGLPQGVLLGLTLSPTCFGVCLPLLIPYFSSEKRPSKTNTGDLGRFLLGRLGGYLAIGALAGWVGQVWFSVRQHARILEGAGFIGVGAALLLYGLVKSFPHWSACRFLESLPLLKRTPLWLGVFTGLNICPPFLAALFAAWSAGGAIKGILVFTGFFLGTSVVLLPLAAAGALAKWESWKMAARVAAVILGVWFMAQGLAVLM